MPERPLPVPSSGGLPRLRLAGDADEEEDDRRVAAWHDHVMFRGIAYPILWYRPSRPVRRYWHGDPSVAIDTEPCIWCGRSHHHGDVEGSRVPHCGTHTHDRTAKGHPRRIDAKGVSRCTIHHRDYVIMRHPDYQEVNTDA